MYNILGSASRVRSETGLIRGSRGLHARPISDVMRPWLPSLLGPSLLAILKSLDDFRAFLFIPRAYHPCPSPMILKVFNKLSVSAFLFVTTLYRHPYNNLLTLLPTILKFLNDFFSITTLHISFHHYPTIRHCR
jgi:hypothetical protein